MNVPRPEHPRPTLVRDEWINLNGEWSFSFDLARSGIQRRFQYSDGFDATIVVPFCPESELSLVHYRDFIPAIWYQRRITVPESWEGKRVLLHVGAADFETEVYVDGSSVGRHWGGSSAFFFDITRQVRPGANHNLVIAVSDDLRSGRQTGGKQSLEFESAGCFYSRITGIWQTVWLEAMPPSALQDCHIVPLFDQGAFLCTPIIEQAERGSRFSIRVKGRGEIVAEANVLAASHQPVFLPLQKVLPWSPEDPFLYDLEFLLYSPEGELSDTTRSYAGLRGIEIEGSQILLNNEPLYLRMVLDQGYYPSGLWTAPSEDDLNRDIELALGAGFNAARLHQKVFEPRYHYWAEQLGFLTWAESASWGLDINSDHAARNFLTEWREIINRDRNHPSIIAWTTFNESWDISDERQHHRVHIDAYDLTRSLDPTRPINNASGGCHVKTDLYTVHVYEQNPQKLRDLLTPKVDGTVFQTLGEKEAPYEGQPYIVDEFGGIKWAPNLITQVRGSWGYGETPLELEEFYDRLAGQVQALLQLPHLSGYCYTQMTDVEQEQNGLFYYDRTSKFDPARLRKIFGSSYELHHTELPQNSTK